MTLQYIAKAKSKMGGGGSGSVNKGDKGATKIILTGYIIVAKVSFHVIDDPVPGNQSPFTGKRRTSGPKSALDIN